MTSLNRPLETRSRCTSSAWSAVNESPTESFEIRMTVSASVFSFSSTTMLLMVALPMSGVCGYAVTFVVVTPMGPGGGTVTGGGAGAGDVVGGIGCAVGAVPGLPGGVG